MFQLRNRLKRYHALAKNILNVHAGRTRYAPMEGLRAYAALLVFIVHFASNYSIKRSGLDLDSFSVTSITNFRQAITWYIFRSHYGVEIFFLLSGFLIFRMAARSGFSYRHFIINRVLRIYPAFIITLVAIILLQIADNRYIFDWIQFLGNLMFLNAFPETGIVSYSTVTWSLGFEFSFYLLLPLLLLAIGGARRSSPVHMAILGLSAWIFLSFCEPYYMRFLMFFGGAFMAAHTDDSLRFQAGFLSDWSAVLIYAIGGLVFSFTKDFRVFVPIFLVGTYILVLRAMYGNGWLGRLLSYPLMRVLGNLSYSFYLVHGTIIVGIIWKVGFLFNWQLKIPIIGEAAYLLTTFATSALVALATAGFVFFFAERPYFSKDRVVSQAKLFKEPTA